MRTILAVSLFALLVCTNADAGRLDVAVIQFPEEKTPEELNAALANQSLQEITDANRTRTSESYLKGGTVLFAQSIAASRGSTFGSATRLKDSRADVKGQLGASAISLEISLMEGVKAGLRNFQKKNYVGSGTLPNGAPRILSTRQIKMKSPSVLKGQTKMERSTVTVVVVAQYTP